MRVREVFETPHDCPPKWAFMLTAYLDETGHEGKDLVILAGFLGDAEQWKKCESDWRVGLGRRDHLHMNELRWSKPERIKKLLDKLGPIPHAAGLQAISSLVRVADYEDLIDGTPMQKLMKGYFITLLGIIDVVAKHIPEEETFKLVLEVQKEYANGSLQIYSGMDRRTRGGKRKLVSLEYVEKDESLLAEPGDFLAFALLQLYRDANSTKSKLCAPILKNTRPALQANHLNQTVLLRKFVSGLAAKYPNLLFESHHPLRISAKSSTEILAPIFDVPLSLSKLVAKVKRRYDGRMKSNPKPVLAGWLGGAH